MAEQNAVRIVLHQPEGIPDCGSFEAIWPDGHRFFYWDDVPGRRLRPDAMTRDQALEAVKAFARVKMAKLTAK